ncbi:MAG TPA: hypothetical protein VK857_11040, partial [Desulforhopalus sp.]|nr:hypothetical protein [Desulforhopalus sp.]
LNLPPAELGLNKLCVNPEIAFESMRQAQAEATAAAAATARENREKAAKRPPKTTEQQAKAEER